MHFPDTKVFENNCFTLQQSDEFPVWTATSWIYDHASNTAQTVLVNPILETQLSVTISCTEPKLLKVIARIDNYFTRTFSHRFIDGFIPYNRLVTEYPNWEHFSNSWLRRNGKNITKASIPLLVVNNENARKLHISLFVPKTNEFYAFGILYEDNADYSRIKKELTNLVKETYGTRSTT